MTELVRRRFLRPGELVTAGPRLWVVDRTQSVALLLDSFSGEQLGLLKWSQTPAGSSPERRVALGVDDGLWVQQHGGPLVLVGEEGALHGRYVSDTVLGAVSGHGAWCAPEPRPPAGHRRHARRAAFGLPHVSETGVGSRERASRGRRSAVGYGSVILCSAALGAAGLLPFVMALYAADQLVLAPLGLTRGDPTNDDGAAPVVIVGVLIPAVVLTIWAFLTVVLVLDHQDAGRCNPRRLRSHRHQHPLRHHRSRTPHRPSSDGAAFSLLLRASPAHHGTWPARRGTLARNAS